MSTEREEAMRTDHEPREECPACGNHLGKSCTQMGIFVPCCFACGWTGVLMEEIIEPSEEVRP